MTVAHGFVSGSVDGGEMLENGVIGRGRISGAVRVGVVERIRSHDGATVKIRRKNEGRRSDPLHQRQRLMGRQGRGGGFG